MKLFITFWNTWINKWKLEVMRFRKSSRSNSFGCNNFRINKSRVWSFDFQKRKNWSGVVEIADTMKEKGNDTINFGTMPLRRDWMWRNWTVKLWKTWRPLLNLCWVSSLFSRRRNFKFLSKRQICVKFVFKTVCLFLYYFVQYKRKKKKINFWTIILYKNSHSNIFGM